MTTITNTAPDDEFEQNVDGVVAQMKHYGVKTVGELVEAQRVESEVYALRTWLIENYEAILAIKERYLDEDVTPDNVDAFVEQLTPEDKQHLYSLAKSNEVLKTMLAHRGAPIDEDGCQA